MHSLNIMPINSPFLGKLLQFLNLNYGHVGEKKPYKYLGHNSPTSGLFGCSCLPPLGLHSSPAAFLSRTSWTWVLRHNILAKLLTHQWHWFEILVQKRILFHWRDFMANIPAPSKTSTWNLKIMVSKKESPFPGSLFSGSMLVFGVV